jgi:condensin complex subunit 2
MPRVESIKPRRSRLSTSNAAYGPLGEGSTSNLPPPPLINNDAAEKANRRKSAHFGEIGVAPGDMAPPSSAVVRTAQPGKRVVSALAVQAGREGRRLGKRLSAVNPEMVGVSWEQRESKYEEWMKAAIDNVCSFFQGSVCS